MTVPEMPTPTQAPAGRKFLIIGLITFGVVAILAGAAGAAGLAWMYFNQRSNSIPQLLPANTQFYVAATPNLSDVPNIERLRQAFPEMGDGQTNDPLGEQLERELGVTFETDIAPWIGTEVAWSVSDFPLAEMMDRTSLDSIDVASQVKLTVIMASRDDQAAQAFLDKQRQHREGEGQQFTSSEAGGVTIYAQEDGQDGNPLTAFALVRRHVVFASSPDLIAAMATIDPGSSETLEANPRFQKVRAALPENRLGYLYVDGSPLMEVFTTNIDTLRETIGESGAAQFEEQIAISRAIEGVGMSISAEAEGLAIDAVTTIDRAQLTPEILAQIEAAAVAIDPERIARVSDKAVAAMSFRIPATLGEQMMNMMRSMPDGEAQLDSMEQSLGLNLEQDFLSWFHGEATLVLMPGEAMFDTDMPITGYFTLRPEDLPAAEAGMEKIIGALESATGALGMREEDLGGAAWQVAGPDQEVVAGYAFINDELVIGFGPEAMTSVAGADQRLGDQSAYQTAIKPLPTPNNGLMFVDMPAVVAVMEAQGGADAEMAERMKPFKAITAATQPGLDDQGVSKGRLFVMIAP